MATNDQQRNILPDLIWFQPPHPFAALSDIADTPTSDAPTSDAPQNWSSLRPLSLATWKALEIMGVPLLDEAAVLTPQEEQLMMEIYLWLHGEPIAEISEALWTNAWQIMLQRQSEPDEVHLALFRRYRARLILATQAVMVRVIPRPKGKGTDDTPRAVCGPAGFSTIITTILSENRMDQTALLWHTWLPQAFVMYHRALHWHGIWTVPIGEAVEDDAFEDGDLMPDELTGMVDLRED